MEVPDSTLNAGVPFPGVPLVSFPIQAARMSTPGAVTSGCKTKPDKHVQYNPSFNFFCLFRIKICRWIPVVDETTGTESKERVKKDFKI